MPAVILIAVFSVVMIIVTGILNQYARKNYITWEEMMQKYAQPDKYVPWSHKKRMRYYDYSAVIALR